MRKTGIDARRLSPCVRGRPELGMGEIELIRPHELEPGRPLMKQPMRLQFARIIPFPSWIGGMVFGVLLSHLAAATAAEGNPEALSARPNVVLIVIDDMGYGDLSCHGSPHIETPHLDALHETSVRLTDFHVAPMCSPTRGQLMTGLDAMRNGSTVVASSRMMVRSDVPMLPEHFARAGYATGHFGKWHLGENPPHRPEDRGFEEALWFPMQEIGSISDYWENDYFDPALRGTRGRTERCQGYCTDVFFARAVEWMQSRRDAGAPFLCTIAMNVVHGPQWAPKDLRERIGRRFPDLTAGQIGYLAMLANADENIGRLEKFLEQSGCAENTIVAFLSDNGGYALIGRYNAGMRDGKSRLAEGGHRVPCFIRWPAGGIGGRGKGRDAGGLTQVQDLLPTLLDLCGVDAVAGSAFDGISLAGVLRGEQRAPDRTLIVQYGPPRPFHMACVLQGRWRLLTDVKGAASGAPELYDLDRDPLQGHNRYADEPQKARELHAAYDRWWEDVEPYTRRRAAVWLGDPSAEQVALNCAEWRENALSSVALLRSGVARRGVWDVEVRRPGIYEVSLRRWPAESGLGLRDAAPAWTPRDAATPNHAGFPKGGALPIATAEIRIGDKRLRSTVDDGASAALFQLPLPAGPTEIEGIFRNFEGKFVCGAYFATVRRIAEDE